MKKKLDPVRDRNGRKVLELENYLTYYLVVIANRVSRGASALYREKFGVGVVEWRCMVMLAMQDGVSAARISEVGGINKSMVSRSLARLEELGYVEDYRGSSTLKPRLMQFTRSGRKLYRDMLEVTIKRDEKLRDGLSEAEQEELLRLLKKLFNNADELDQTKYHVNIY